MTTDAAATMIPKHATEKSEKATRTASTSVNKKCKTSRKVMQSNLNH